MIRIALRATQPLRIVPSLKGPLFRPDFEKIEARRIAAAKTSRPSQPAVIRIVKKPASPATPPSGFRRKAASSSAAFPGVRDRILLERYEVIEKLGEGGTGVVYRAEDRFLKMPVAIKVLHPALTHDSLAVAALKEEARTAMRMSHPHIVHLHNLEKAGNRYFLVMEYIQGNTYRDLLNLYKHLALDTVIETLKVCAHALSYAHRRRVLHNDLKPENLLITREGLLKIIDFGIACLLHTAQPDFIMGTPCYMSPEQIRGEKLDERTDVYSLGIMTYEFLTGRTPFPDDVGLEDVLRLLPVELPDLPEELRAPIRKAIFPNREERWNSVEAYVQAFVAAAEPIVSPAKEDVPSPNNAALSDGDPPP